MNSEELKRIVLGIIHGIAPEADTAGLNPGARLRDQIDFDSVDFMNFAVALQEKLKVAIPETDFPRLATLDGCVEYLMEKTG